MTSEEGFHLVCEADGCRRRGYALSSSGRVLCRDCWAWVEVPHKDGSGFVEWVRSVLARRRSTS